MLRYICTVRGFAITVLVLGALAYVIAQPTLAGTQAADALGTVLGWGRKIASAIATFATNLIH